MTAVRRCEIRETGIVGTLFEPSRDPVGFVVVLSGSGGGVPEGYAQRLAERGITAFALGYFGAPGLPPALIEIPIERLERGIEWFRDHSADGSPVAVLGSSKGAELALILGAYLGEAIDRIVAIAPTCVAWYGLDQADPTSGDRPSWTFSGQPIPFLPYVRDVRPLFGPEGMRVDMCYDLSRYDMSQVAHATIPVERSRASILLISGGDDHMWPAASFAERVVERRPADMTNVVYPGAGHAFLHREFFANRDVDGRPIWDFGGDEEHDAAASSDTWPRVVTFLKSKVDSVADIS